MDHCRFPWRRKLRCPRREISWPVKIGIVIGRCVGRPLAGPWLAGVKARAIRFAGIPIRSEATPDQLAEAICREPWPHDPRASAIHLEAEWWCGAYGAHSVCIWRRQSPRGKFWAAGIIASGNAHRLLCPSKSISPAIRCCAAADPVADGSHFRNSFPLFPTPHQPSPPSFLACLHRMRES